MQKRNEDLGLLAVSVVFLVLSLAGLAAAFATRLITNIDGLLLVIICLMMGGLFTLMLIGIAMEEGWLPSRKTKSDNSAAKSAKPGEGK